MLAQSDESSRSPILPSHHGGSCTGINLGRDCLRLAETNPIHSSLFVEPPSLPRPLSFLWTDLHTYLVLLRGRLAPSSQGEIQYTLISTCLHCPCPFVVVRFFYCTVPPSVSVVSGKEEVGTVPVPGTVTYRTGLACATSFFSHFHLHHITIHYCTWLK